MSLGALDRPAPRRSLLGSLLLLAYCLALFWTGGLLRFVADLQTLEQPRDERATDAIVVLTGGAERIDVGLKLLQAGRAKRMLITGVNKGTSADMLQQLRGQYPPQLFACCVALGTAAEDTVGNAAETAVWAQKEGYTSLRLVTGAYHLPRSLVEFRRFMPAVVLMAHPVYTEHVRLADWWRNPGTARLLAGEFNKYLVSLARARLVANRK